MSGYYLKNGNWWIDKDPDDQLFYAIDLANELALSGASIRSISAIAAGVQVLATPVVNATQGVVKLGGLDTTAGAVNSCCLRFVLTNGEQLDKTIYFKRKDN